MVRAYYWTSSELGMAGVHISICELLSDCESVGLGLQLHAFYGKGAYLATSQSALEFCPIHCPNGRLGQDLGFGGSAFALKLPELLNRNLVAVRANILFP